MFQQIIEEIPKILNVINPGSHQYNSNIASHFLKGQCIKIFECIKHIRVNA